jgi:predicted enzyme related to lactoylglutathione lyase
MVKFIYRIGGFKMKIGEVCLLTSDVIRLSNFYKMLFNIDNNSDDNIHQFIISEETTLTIYNDGKERKTNPHNICIAFTVNDVDIEFERLKALGVEIVEPPTVRPWGVKNMNFLDPDNNLITFRCFPK